MVRRYGDGIFPVTVLVTFADGAQTRTPWDGGNRWKLISLEHATEAVSAQVDPDQVLLLDTNFTNNSYAIAPRRTARRHEMGGRVDGVAAGSAAHVGVLRMKAQAQARLGGA